MNNSVVLLVKAMRVNMKIALGLEGSWKGRWKKQRGIEKRRKEQERAGEGGLLVLTMVFIAL